MNITIGLSSLRLDAQKSAPLTLNEPIGLGRNAELGIRHNSILCSHRHGPSGARFVSHCRQLVLAQCSGVLLGVAGMDSDTYTGRRTGAFVVPVCRYVAKAIDTSNTRCGVLCDGRSAYGIACVRSCMVLSDWVLRGRSFRKTDFPVGR